MNRPAARLWAGALVLGAISHLHSAPVRLSVDSDHAPSDNQVAPPARRGSAPIVASESPEYFDRWAPELAIPSRELPTSGYVSTPGAQSTLAIPLPPAVWPAGATIGAFAGLAVIRRYRRR